MVFATGYELADGVPSAGHRRSCTWAFATYPQPQALWGCGELIWEAADPYLYIRTTVDGRVVVGGEDEDMQDDKTRDALLPVKIGHLQQKTNGLLPWLDVSTMPSSSRACRRISKKPKATSSVSSRYSR